ncbi:Endogenous retrovirus group S71 member 1 Env polyprotein [Plecturocebus cupreus]
MPVVPATQEAEAGNCLNPGGRDHSEPRSRQCTTAWVTMSGTVAHTCNQSTFRGRGGRIMRSGDQDHPGQHGEIPSLLKIKKLAACGGVCLKPSEQEKIFANHASDKSLISSMYKKLKQIYKKNNKPIKKAKAGESQGQDIETILANMVQDIIQSLIQGAHPNSVPDRSGPCHTFHPGDLATCNESLLTSLNPSVSYQAPNSTWLTCTSGLSCCISGTEPGPVLSTCTDDQKDNFSSLPLNCIPGPAELSHSLCPFWLALDLTLSPRLEYSGTISAHCNR